jgi:PIN like domain
MVANADSLRFYVDESALGLGKALTIARRDTIHVGHRLIPECPLGVLDPDWIPAVARRGLVVIGRDKHIRTKPEEIRQLRSAGLRVFRIGGKRDLATWDWLVRVVRRWDDIEHVLRSRPEGPWFYLINENGLAEVQLE